MTTRRSRAARVVSRGASLWLGVAFAAAAIPAAEPPPHAAASMPGGIHAEHAWIRWLPGGLPAAGYVKLVNDADRAVMLVGASSDAYRDVSLHRTVTRGNMMQMDRVDRLPIAAGASIDFAATGYHLMLGEPKRPVQPGDFISVQLHFADGPALTVSFAVRKPDAASE